jgi:hypothetical protein
LTITDYQQTRLGNVVTVTVTSDLSGVIYYHWYLDGLYVGVTEANEQSFYLDPDEQARVECVDTNSATFDPVANAPEGFPARRTLWWVRSLATDVEHYRVEQQAEGSQTWTTIGLVEHEADRWHYSLMTDRLDDLTTYTWRVVPVDTLGNDGTATTIGPEKIVRAPDAPDWTLSYDEGTDQVTFAAV